MTFKGVPNKDCTGPGVPVPVSVLYVHLFSHDLLVSILLALLPISATPLLAPLTYL